MTVVGTFQISNTLKRTNRQGSCYVSLNTLFYRRPCTFLAVVYSLSEFFIEYKKILTYCKLQLKT